MTILDIPVEYEGELLRLIRYYPEANCYAYYKENMSGYGFIRENDELRRQIP